MNSTEIQWACSGLFFLLLVAFGLLTVSIFKKRQSSQGQPRQSSFGNPHPQTHVIIPTIMSLFLRACWFFSHFEDDVHTHSLMWRLISRVSILLQFSACLNLVYIWFVVSLFSSTATTQLKKRAMFAVYALNLIFYSGILLTTRSSGGNKNNTADMMYRINIAILAIVFLLIFSGVTLRGLSLIKLINTLGSTTAVNEKSERALKQITRISAAFLVCFLIRSVMFSFTPITGRGE